ncbi:hypothetical protein OUZ56_024146 [Daphnia magna]|uniref:Uncharacterized protein n=1 Tax=Daphnia magna TaxID=35525 RepID=A0ABR0B091_9CRUS|nr:hypothetical protein OUZ56_024146 [Daphnia magna]
MHVTGHKRGSPVNFSTLTTGKAPLRCDLRSFDREKVDPHSLNWTEFLEIEASSETRAKVDNDKRNTSFLERSSKERFALFPRSLTNLSAPSTFQIYPSGRPPTRIAESNSNHSTRDPNVFDGTNHPIVPIRLRKQLMWTDGFHPAEVAPLLPKGLALGNVSRESPGDEDEGSRLDLRMCLACGRCQLAIGWRQNYRDVACELQGKREPYLARPVGRH